MKDKNKKPSIGCVLMAIPVVLAFSFYSVWVIYIAAGWALGVFGVGIPPANYPRVAAAWVLSWLIGLVLRGWRQERE